MADTFGPEAGELMAAAGKPLDDWQQDSVSAILSLGSDRLWSCFEYCEICSRQNGKGAILEARVLTGFLLLNEGVIAWSAHEYRTSMEAFRRVRALLLALGTQVNDTLIEINHPLVIGEGKPIPVKIVNTNGEEGFERLDDPNGDGEAPRIKFIARSKRAGRGFSGDLIIIDEAFAYTAEQQEAQMPITLARPNPQVIYASSPPLSGDTGEVLFDLRERAEEELERQIKAAVEELVDDIERESLGFRDWGLAGCLEDVTEVDKATGRPRIDINDVSLWYQANPALGSSRFTLANIRKLKRAMRVSKGKGFARECLGLWPRRVKANARIDSAKWKEMRDPGSHRRGDVALAFDIAPDRSWAAVGLYAIRADGKGHMQLVDYRAGTDWLVARLVELKVVLDPLAIACGKGSYESMKVDLAKSGLKIHNPTQELAPRRGHIAVTTVTDMAAATGRILDTVNRRSAFHLGQEELDDSVEVAQTRRSGDSIAWTRTGAEGDICPLVAVTLAQWSFEVRGPMVQEEKYDVLDSIG